MVSIRVIDQTDSVPTDGVEEFVLKHDTWNDWWDWETLFTVYYFDEHGQRSRIGAIKIASIPMSGKGPDLPASFSNLDDHYCSIGQDESYYEALVALGPRAGNQFLLALNDLVLRPELLDRYMGEEVVGRSLLRHVSLASIKGQFSRVLAGGEKRQSFDLSYIEPEAGLDLHFKVSPESVPPTNIHVLIGRNGSGKTRLLSRMSDALLGRRGIKYNHFRSADGLPVEESIAGLGHVSFSAFDRNPPLRTSDVGGLTIFNVGLKEEVVVRLPNGREKRGVALKDYEGVLADMGKALYVCASKSLDRWKSAVGVLEADPIFREESVLDLAEDVSPAGLSEPAKRRFRRLSSGHQVVLLTITSIVAFVEERTLVMLDEPEGHLHPPLLSAFIRALSEVLTEMNAFAIVATHSPVILQEVPAECVHLVRRAGDDTAISRPARETFGENVGILTRDVFGLEVEASGFSRLVREQMFDKGASFNAVFDAFEGKLGSEAIALISSYLIQQGQEIPSVDLEF